MSASMSQSLCTNRATTTFFLPEARVIGLLRIRAMAIVTTCIATTCFSYPEQA